MTRRRPSRSVGEPGLKRSPPTGQEAQAADASPLPLYHRIYMVLHEQITEGHFRTDRPMPSEVELGRTFGVSRVTIRKTLERLENEGLIVRQRGRGTFAQPQKASRAVDAGIRGLMENLLAMGLRTRVKVLEFEYIPASDQIAAALEIPRGAAVQKAVRLRSHKGLPFSYATTWVPGDVGCTYTRADLARMPFLQLLDRAGIKVARAYQRVTARAADATVAPHIDVDVGAPLLCIIRIVRDQDGRPVEYIRALYRPDRYEFEINLDMAGPAADESGLWAPAGGSL